MNVHSFLNFLLGGICLVSLVNGQILNLNILYLIDESVMGTHIESLGVY